MKLGEHDAIVAVVPERVEGPGWKMLVLRVFIQDGDGNIRRETMQPDGWKESMELRALADIGALVCWKMQQAVDRLVEAG